MPLAEWVDFPEHCADSGRLVAIEAGTSVPFEIRRVYYLYGLDTTSRRGFHAHKKLQQVAICLHGSCRFLLDDGHTKEEVLLDQPNRGLLIRSFLWREMFEFSEGCVLVVLASELYDEGDYVRDYKEFASAARA